MQEEMKQRKSQIKTVERNKVMTDSGGVWTLLDQNIKKAEDLTFVYD